MKNHFTANVTTSTTREYDVINMSNATPQRQSWYVCSIGSGNEAFQCSGYDFQFGCVQFLIWYDFIFSEGDNVTMYIAEITLLNC